MPLNKLKEIWLASYAVVPEQLEKVKQIRSATTAFNTNIDAVLKISGTEISKLAAQTNLTENEFLSAGTNLNTPKDVVRGILKCFAAGIAEEWVTDNREIYQWMSENLGYDRLQMGGQGGIVANALAVLGVQKVFVHTNSHPELQARQFLNLPNLFAVDENGKIQPAAQINRSADTPLIHWIIEFDRGDCAECFGKKIICPKSNRFIATYDPANMDLVINDGFVRHLNESSYDYLILSGYHNLTSARNGVTLVKNSVPLLKEWKRNNPDGIVHLELASTQDKAVRRAIIENIAPLADSVGLNERELLDALEIIDEKQYQALKAEKLTAVNLFEALKTLKEKTCAPRLQLHMFGLYLTLQDKDYKLTPLQNKNGMMLAATIAATKAGTGKITEAKNLLWAHGQTVGETGLNELLALERYLNLTNLAQTGIAELPDFNLTAVPTILIEKPLTLVGMGDTISSVSLLGAR